MYSFSYWEREAFLKNWDFVVIGSGIVGLNAAIHYKKLRPQANVVVLERGFLPTGASTRNAGFSCFGSVSELLDDIASGTPEAEVFALVKRRYDGLIRLREIHGDSSIGYEEAGGFEIFTDEAAFQECASQIGFLNDKMEEVLGLKGVYSVLSPSEAVQHGLGKVKYIIYNKYEGILNTAMLIQSLWNKAQEAGVKIFTGVTVSKYVLKPDHVELELLPGFLQEAAPGGAAIAVPQVLVCTNGFARQLMPELEVSPARNQVLLTAPVPGLALKGGYHYEQGYFYFRNVDGRILLGGGRHLQKEAETTAELGETMPIREALEELLHEIILPGQQVSIEQSWSGIMGVGGIKKPIIQKLSNQLGIAVRMGGMGVAIGTLVGQEGAEMMLQPE